MMSSTILNCEKRSTLWQRFLVARARSPRSQGTIFAEKSNILGSSKKSTRYVIGIIVCISGLILGLIGSFHALLFWSKLQGLHPNLNQLLVGPVQLTWVFAGISLCRTGSQWSRWLVFIGTLMAFICFLFKLSPFETQDNAPLIALFLPFYIGLCWSCWILPNKR